MNVHMGDLWKTASYNKLHRNLQINGASPNKGALYNLEGHSN